ncbi:MAG: phosphotransferase [Ferruginibacter sp.]
MRIDNKTINGFIFNQFGQLPSAVEQVEMGVMTFKYKVKVEGQDYMLRIYPPANTTNVALEFKIMQQLFFRGCKVPEPVGYNNETSTACLIYKYIPGLALSQLPDAISNETADIIAAQIVDNIIALSKEPISGFGFLLSSEKLFNNWQSFLQDAIDRGEQHLASIKKLITIP